MVSEKALKYYESIKDELLKHREGKFVLIRLKEGNNMFKKVIVVCVVVFLVCFRITGYAQEKFSNRIVSEKLITQIDFFS